MGALTLLVVAGASAAAPTLMVLGDSLSSGYGFDPARGWVALLADRLQRSHPPYRVVNASISGDTTRGARTRLEAALERYQPAVVIVELGGNDGLRGLPLPETRANLAAMITVLHERGIRVLLTGIRLPPNYGARYTQAFAAMYQELSERFDVALVPFLLEGVATDPRLTQEDGIHPRAEAQPRILSNVWLHLEPLL